MCDVAHRTALADEDGDEADPREEAGQQPHVPAGRANSILYDDGKELCWPARRSSPRAGSYFPVMFRLYV